MWQRLPLPFRAVVTGLVVTLVPTLASGVAQAASGTVALMPAFAAVAFAAVSIVAFRLLARRGRIAPAALPALGS